MKAVKMLFVVIACVTVAACGPTQSKSPAQKLALAPQEVLLWSSAAERPAWIDEEPDGKDGKMWFVGVSGRYATEQLARDDASGTASKNVVRYMGTLVKDKIEKARISFGLASDVVDPTSSAKQFEKLMAVNMASKVKPSKWYHEKWQTQTGIGYNTYVLAYVPNEAIDQPYKDLAASQARDAERKAKEANDQFAQSQAQKAAEFWKQMSETNATEE